MTVKLITHNGETNTKAGWARKLGISCESITQRLNRGWSIADTLTTPRHGRRMLARAITTADHAKMGQTVAMAAEQTMRKIVAQSDSALAPIALLPFEELKRQHLAIQRQFNSTLRQFNRDLHALMSRSLDRGVVIDLSENANDRSTPIT